MSLSSLDQTFAQPDYGAAYAELRRTVIAAGLLERKYGYYFAHTSPGKGLAPRLGVLPAPRKAVPALESKIEKVDPDWKMVTPLNDHPPKSA